jgi:hypothetical protein
VIDDLMDYAARSAELKTGVGMMAAARLLAEAGRLKGLLELSATAVLPPRPIPTREEWMRLYAPRETWPSHMREEG